MATKAEVYLAKILSAPDPFKFLEDAVTGTDPFFEEEWIEFKSGADGPAAALKPLSDGSVKAIWSTALSGFANTGGGLLIWGVDCRAHERPPGSGVKVDAACGVRAVLNPDALKSRLLSLHHGATDPAVTGVTIDSIPNPGTAEGFVVCHVPVGAVPPYSADLVTNAPCYLRVGDDFVLMPKSILRRMFWPESHARFVIDVDGYAESGSVQNPHAHFRVSIKNTGNATAHDVYIRVACVSGWRPSTRNHMVRQDEKADWRRFGDDNNFIAFEAVRPLHPGVSSEMPSWHVPIDGGWNYDTVSTLLTFEIFARDEPAVKQSAAFPMARFLGLMHVQATPEEDVE